MEGCVILFLPIVFKIHFFPLNRAYIIIVVQWPDFKYVRTFCVAYMGNLWFELPIDRNIEHHIFQSINFLYTQHGITDQ